MPTQDFKGTINGNTITAGTGTLTMAAGKTLTVNESATITETPPLNANVIKGDGTAGRVVRSIRITIGNGTTGVSIKCQSYSVWNGDANALQDDIAKGATAGVWKLSADGITVTLLNTGITGDAVAVLATSIYSNASGTALLIAAYTDASGINIYFAQTAADVNPDISTLVNTGAIGVYVTYITSA